MIRRPPRSTPFPTRRSSDLVQDGARPIGRGVVHRDDLETELDFMETPHQGLDRRSEEHTSELQSLAYLVCRLLLEKKNALPVYQSDRNGTSTSEDELRRIAA